MRVFFIYPDGFIYSFCGTYELQGKFHISVKKLKTMFANEKVLSLLEVFFICVHIYNHFLNKFKNIERVLKLIRKETNTIHRPRD